MHPKLATHSVPDNARIILFGGRLHENDSPRQAAWAFDVLKYVDPRLHLVFIGEGPQKSNVQRLAASLGFDDFRAHFAPDEELTYWRGRAELVWLTAPMGGVRSAKAALAHGLPVIAMQTPELGGQLGESEEMKLVPPGDRIALAKATKKLLDARAAAVEGNRFLPGIVVEG